MAVGIDKAGNRIIR